MEISKWNKDSWDTFVDASLQGTAFHKSCFLESYNHPVTYLRCSKGNEDFAGFAFVEYPDGIRFPPYLAIGGIILKDFSDLKNYRRNELTFKIMGMFATYLFDNYRCVEFPLHWDIVDIRAFDWVNYHERQKGYYQINIRYTSLMDISRSEDTSTYARLRQRDLKKAKSELQFVTKISDDIDLLIRLYKVNFEKRVTGRVDEYIEALKNICQNLISAGWGKLFVTTVNGEPAVASFFVYDHLRAYHLFVGTDLQFRELGVSTKNLYDCCYYFSKEMNIKQLDMVGVNSPQRGEYKLSFGGTIVPYCQIIKIPPKLS